MYLSYLPSFCYLCSLTFLCLGSPCEIPYGLAVRIPGFHPGGPGSSPGMETHFLHCKCTKLAGVFLRFYQTLRLVKVLYCSFDES